MSDAPKSESNALKAVGELKGAAIDALDAATDVPLELVESSANAVQKIAVSAKRAKKAGADFLKNL